MIKSNQEDILSVSHSASGGRWFGERINNVDVYPKSVEKGKKKLN